MSFAVMIKADDFIVGRHVSEWSAFLSLLAEQNVGAALGVIGAPSVTGLEEGAENVIELVDQIKGSSQLEIFNHGWVHRHDEFVGWNVDDQVGKIELGQRFIARCFGEESHVFGAPKNRLDKNTLAACDSIAGIKVVFQASKDRSYLAIPSSRFLNCENKELGFDPDLRLLKRHFSRHPGLGTAISVLQVHPWRWSAKGRKAFGLILAYLRAQGGSFITPTDWYRAQTGFDISCNLSEMRTDEISRAVDARALRLLEEQSPGSTLKHGFFRSRYEVGLAEWIGRLTATGVIDVEGGCSQILDIGCGVGQWSLASAVAKPKAKVTAIDPSPIFTKYFKTLLSGTQLANRISVHQTDAEADIGARGVFDATLMPGVLMYTDIEKAIRNVSRVSRIGARHYVVSHLDGHYFRRIGEALNEKDGVKGASAMIRAFLSTQQFNAGVCSTITRERGLPRQDLLSCYKAFGLEPLSFPASWQQEPESFQGLPTFIECVLEKSEEPELGDDGYVNCVQMTPREMQGLVARGMPRSVFSALANSDGEYLYDEPEIADLFVTAAIKSGEVQSVPPMLVSRCGPSAAARYLYQAGRIDQAIPELIMAAAAGDEYAVCLHALCLRFDRRLEEGCTLLHAAIQDDPDNIANWSAWFYLESLRGEDSLRQVFGTWLESRQ